MSGTMSAIAGTMSAYGAIMSTCCFSSCQMTIVYIQYIVNTHDSSSMFVV